MAIILSNNWITISKSDSKYFPLSSSLSRMETRRVFNTKGSTKSEKKKELVKFYNEDETNIYVPRGLWKFIRDNVGKDYKDVQYKSELYDCYDKINNIEDFRNILPGIELANEQLIAVRKMIAVKRCLIQMPTGSGKTEVICAFLKIFNKLYGYYPTTVILEPTLVLVQGTLDRLSKYGIDGESYSNTRQIEKNKIYVTHPTSMFNDKTKNDYLLDDVSILISDECHHMASEHSRSLTFNMPKLEYSVGVSASAIDIEHIYGKTLNDFSEREILSIGATGPLVMNVTSGYYIKKKMLATPILLRMKNICTENIHTSNIVDWHKIREYRLQSDKRNRMLSCCAEFFMNHNRKVLILVSTREWTDQFLSIFDEYGLSSVTRASLGGKTFRACVDGEIQNVKEDVFGKYNSGEVKILIGTTHLYEGVDIPNLDVIILAYGGKGQRMHVQGIGRALRKTKTGKYAYIVDCTDDNDVVLSKHSSIRMNRYKEMIGITEDRIYDDVLVSDLEEIFGKLEDV